MYFQIEELEKKKLCLECNLKGDKKQILDLETRFQVFVSYLILLALEMLFIFDFITHFVLIQLRNRGELKQKLKMMEKECNCLTDKNNLLQTENENLKSCMEVSRKDNEQYAAQKVRYIR